MKSHKNKRNSKKLNEVVLEVFQSPKVRENNILSPQILNTWFSAVVFFRDVCLAKVAIIRRNVEDVEKVRDPP